MIWPQWRSKARVPRPMLTSWGYCTDDIPTITVRAQSMSMVEVAEKYPLFFQSLVDGIDRREAIMRGIEPHQVWVDEVQGFGDGS